MPGCNQCSPLSINTLRNSLLLCLIAWALPHIANADWPQFGGPNRNAILADVELDPDWTAHPPSKVWEAPLGKGFGGPAVAGNDVFLLDWVDDEKLFIRCLNLTDGKERWNYTEPLLGRFSFPGSRGVPLVDDKKVYAISPMGVVYAIDRATGKLVWRVDQVERFGGVTPLHGYAQSALKIGEMIIVAPFGPNACLAALNAADGATLWTTGIQQECHSTPTLIKLLGEPLILFLTGTRETGVLLGVRPEDGKLRLKYDGYPQSSAIPMPVQISTDTLFLTGGANTGSQMVRATQGTEMIEVQKLFSIPKGVEIHLPVLHGDYIYMMTNEMSNLQVKAKLKEGGLMCLDLQGNEKWRTGNDPNFGRGGLILVGDHLVTQDGNSGFVRLVKATPERYEELGSFNAFDIQEDPGKDRQMWAMPTLSGDKLLVRSQENWSASRSP